MCELQVEVLHVCYGVKVWLNAQYIAQDRN
jgi:hypothetical protein